MVHREDVATTTLGLGGVAGAGALRHHALELAYEGKPRPNLPVVNLPLLHERKLFTRGAKGRGPYAAGAALGAVSAPAAAVGINRMYTRRKRKPVAKRDQDKPRPTFLEAGLAGAKNAVVDRTQTISNPAPARLVAGNYLAGAGIASGAGGLSHLAMRNTKIPSHGKAAIAAATGAAAGALSLPAQSSLTRRATRGKYEVTPTGVRRAKAKRVPASRMASVHEGRSRYGGDAHRYRSETVPGGVSKDDPLDYPGSDKSRKAKRAIVGSVVGPPIIGDLAQASTAAAMAPPPLRKETAARTYAGGQIGAHAGNLAGAYGAVALANKSPHFRRGAEKVGHHVERLENAARRKIGMRPKPAVGAIERAVARSPKAVKTLARPLLKNPVVAGIGGLAGGAVGGQAGIQAGYGSALNREQKWRNAQRRGQTATHGSRRIAKADEPPKALNARERKGLAHRKEISAALSMAGGTAGLAALGITAGSRHPKINPMQRHLPKLLATGAGIGGANAFLGASVQQREAKQQLAPLPKKTVVIVKPKETASKALRVKRIVPGRSKISRKEIREDYKAHGFMNSAGKPRKMTGQEAEYADWDANPSPLGGALGGIIGARGAIVHGPYPLRGGNRYGVSKAFGVRLAPTGIRRAPAMRRGYIRQTRTPGGLTRVSTVRGGLA